MKHESLQSSGIKRLRARNKCCTITDGAGLALEVHPSGVKSWRVRYRLRGKASIVNVGRWPEVSLDEARVKRDKIMTDVRAGLSPTEARRKEQEIALQGSTVREFGDQYMREIVAKNTKDPAAVQRYLDRDIYPVIGAKPVRLVHADDLRAIIFARRDAGRRYAALAIRDLLQRLWDYAIVCGVAVNNPVHAIPRKYVATAKPRRRFLTPAEVGTFINLLDASRLRSNLKLAFKLILLTLTRKSELLLARWEHIDLDNGEWTIPAEHSKNNQPHVVYLSNQAREILRDLKEWHPGRKVNPDYCVIPQLWSRTQPMAEATLNRALQRTITGEMDHFTVHDLRRTGATLLSEDEYPSDVIEKALNHSVKGVRGVYNRAQYSEQRKKMLQDWADKVQDLAIQQRNKLASL